MEGETDADEYLNWDGDTTPLEGETSTDYQEMEGETRNYEGLIGEEPGDKPIIPSGESRNYEGETDAETQVDLSGRTPNYEGEANAETQIVLSGRTPNYEGETKAETEIELSGRTPNYEGLIGTDESLMLDLSGTSRRYEGATDAETEIDLSGTARNYEGEIMTGWRETKHSKPMFQSLNALSWSMVSGSGKAGMVRESLSTGEVYCDSSADGQGNPYFIDTKYATSGSYFIGNHVSHHPQGARQIHSISGSFRVRITALANDPIGQEFDVNNTDDMSVLLKMIKGVRDSDTISATYQQGWPGMLNTSALRFTNNVTVEYRAAEQTPVFSSVIAAQRFDGMKMTSKPFTITVDENTGENIQTEYEFSSGYAPDVAGKYGIIPSDWLNLSNSTETTDGGPVVEVNDTSPTQFVVSQGPSEDVPIVTD